MILPTVQITRPLLSTNRWVLTTLGHLSGQKIRIYSLSILECLSEAYEMVRSVSVNFISLFSSRDGLQEEEPQTALSPRPSHVHLI